MTRRYVLRKSQIPSHKHGHRSGTCSVLLYGAVALAVVGILAVAAYLSVSLRHLPFCDSDSQSDQSCIPCPNRAQCKLGTATCQNGFALSPDSLCVPTENRLAFLEVLKESAVSMLHVRALEKRCNDYSDGRTRPVSMANSDLSAKLKEEHGSHELWNNDFLKDEYWKESVATSGVELTSTHVHAHVPLSIDFLKCEAMYLLWANMWWFVALMLFNVAIIVILVSRCTSSRASEIAARIIDDLKVQREARALDFIRAELGDTVTPKLWKKICCKVESDPRTMRITRVFGVHDRDCWKWIDASYSGEAGRLS